MHTDFAYEEIFDEIVPEVLELFRAKAADYSDAPHFLLLGSKGQFAEINKKFWKLYNGVWQGKELRYEKPEEIAMDLIGHCFLMIYSLRHDES